ncbi:MAG: hypothetical protein M3Y39_18820 [Chloroflexota bacterium]|nr:hypothetical protein [Chloroflexota bacterium]
MVVLLTFLMMMSLLIGGMFFHLHLYKHGAIRPSSSGEESLNIDNQIKLLVLQKSR